MTTNYPLGLNAAADRTLSGPAGRAGAAAGRGWWRILRTWAGRRRQRAALARLDDRLLADVGITRAQAAREAGKPFWR